MVESRTAVRQIVAARSDAGQHWRRFRAGMVESRNAVRQIVATRSRGRPAPAMGFAWLWWDREERRSVGCCPACRCAARGQGRLAASRRVGANREEEAVRRALVVRRRSGSAPMRRRRSGLTPAFSAARVGRAEQAFRRLRLRLIGCGARGPGIAEVDCDELPRGAVRSPTFASWGDRPERGPPLRPIRRGSSAPSYGHCRPGQRCRRPSRGWGRSR
jgi:hypothetical protein